MKQIYTRIPFIIPLLVSVLFTKQAAAQCSCTGGSAPQTVVHRTLISTSMESTNFSFPQFDPTVGQLICANVSATITATTRIRIENDEIFDATYRISYARTSTISGPGLNPTLVSSYSKGYGPYDLAASDGVYFSGPDYLITNRDTVLNKKKLEATINSDVTPFLGYGSVTYNYNLSTVSRITGGGNYLGGPLTNDIIDFTLTYSYCPTTVLATGLKTFNAELGAENKVNLNWTADSEEPGIAYTTEISRNGREFAQISRILSEGNYSTRYSADYELTEQDPSRLYFRIKRTDRQGRSIYSEVRQVNISSQGMITLHTYPNPATKKITVDFGKLTDGNMLVEIRDPAGKTYQRSTMRVSHSRTLDINLVNMPSGIYFLQTTDQKTGKRYISRLAVSQ